MVEQKPSFFSFYSDDDVKKVYDTALKECRKDFMNRGVGYYEHNGLEFSYVLATDLMVIYFSVYHDIQHKTLDTFEPTTKEIQKYKEEFLK